MSEGPNSSPTLTSLFGAPSVAVDLRKGREEGVRRGGGAAVARWPRAGGVRVGEAGG